MKKEIENIIENPFEFFVQSFKTEKNKESENKTHYCKHVTEIDRFEAKLKIDETIFTIIDCQYETYEFYLNRKNTYDENIDFNLAGRVISINGYEFEMVSKNISNSYVEGISGEKYSDKISIDVLNFIEKIKSSSLDKNLSLIGEQERKNNISIVEKVNTNINVLTKRTNSIKSRLDSSISLVNKNNVMHIFKMFDDSFESIKKGFNLYRIIEKLGVLNAVSIIEKLPENVSYFKKEEHLNKIRSIAIGIKNLLYSQEIDPEDFIIDCKKIMQLKNELMGKFISEFDANYALNKTLEKLTAEICSLRAEEKKETDKLKAGKSFMKKINKKRTIDLIRLPEFILKKILFDRLIDNNVIKKNIEINEALNNSSCPDELLKYFNSLHGLSLQSAIFFASTNNDKLINSVMRKHLSKLS